MIPDPTLTLAWLVLAHFVADFVLQTDRIAIDKGADGQRALMGMARHTAAVAICLVPVALAFGWPGVAFLLIVTVSHGLIDRAKIVWTRRADVAASEAVVSAGGAGGESTGLGPSWTPVPGALFVLDQVVHLAISIVFWAILLTDVPLTTAFSDAVGRLLTRWDPATIHAVSLWIVVIATLLIVNIRAASFFVATLVTPRPTTVPGPPPESEHLATTTVRVGPFTATTETTTRPSPLVTPDAATSAVPPDRVGETIGVLERLLVVVFVLGGAGVAVGLVIAAKTIARFRQLDDRAFAEYYLLGTLASVTVAVVSALIAAAALAL